MRIKDLDTLPFDVVNRLDPVRVQEYARATGWKLEPRLGKGMAAVYERPESRLEQFSVPLSRELLDFSRLMAMSVALMARFEDRPATELLTELLFPPADLLKFAESSPAANAGDVPFEHGVSLLMGARKTLLAAACSALRPLPFHPRMSFTEAEQFLRQCRLGQTERGSFVLTVACPLDAVPMDPDLFSAPFTRQATLLLMRSLDRLAHHLERGDVDGLLHQADDKPILSANLCEGLLDMVPEGDDSFLRVTAAYARTLPLPEDEPAPVLVRLRREIFPRIEHLIPRLRPTQQPRKQLFVGFVETLNGRPNDQNRPEGQVALKLITPEGETLRARVELNADDYARADQAHMRTLPLSLEGVLWQAGRFYRVDQVTDVKVLHQTQTNGEATP